MMSKYTDSIELPASTAMIEFIGDWVSKNLANSQDYLYLKLTGNLSVLNIQT